jgi:hypothetical protein
MLVASASPLTPQGRKRPAEPTRPVFSNSLLGRLQQIDDSLAFILGPAGPWAFTLAVIVAL